MDGRAQPPNSLNDLVTGAERYVRELCRQGPKGQVARGAGIYHEDTALSHYFHTEDRTPELAVWEPHPVGRLPILWDNVGM